MLTVGRLKQHEASNVKIHVFFRITDESLKHQFCWAEITIGSLRFDNSCASDMHATPSSDVNVFGKLLHKAGNDCAEWFPFGRHFSPVTGGFGTLVHSAAARAL